MGPIFISINLFVYIYYFIYLALPIWELRGLHNSN